MTENTDQNEEKLKLWINGITGRMGQEILKYITSSEDYIKSRYAEKIELIGGQGRHTLHTWSNNQLNTEPSEETTRIKYLNNADIILDFSNAKANRELLHALKSCPAIHPRYLLIGSTGLTPEDKKAWESFVHNEFKKDLFILHAPNTSLGILLMTKFAQIAARFLGADFDIELLEAHHRGKADAPSGTALHIADTLCRDLKKTTIYGRTKKRESSEIGISSVRGGSIFGSHTISFLGDQEQISIKHEALSRSLFAKGAITLANWLTTRYLNGIYYLDDIEIDEL